MQRHCSAVNATVLSVCLSACLSLFCWNVITNNATWWLRESPFLTPNVLLITPNIRQMGKICNYNKWLSSSSYFQKLSVARAGPVWRATSERTLAKQKLRMLHICVCVCVWGRNSQQVSADHLQCLLTTPWSGHATTLQLPYVMWNDRKRVTQPFLHLSPSEWMFAGRVISAMCIFARLHVCLSAASRQMAKF